MKKIILTLLTFVFLTACGYTPIYSTKNFDFKLSEINIVKNDQLSSKLKRELQIFSNEESQKIISLKLDVQKKINTLSKNSKGDASRYEMIIDIKLEATNNQQENTRQSFQERFNYNANKNKFELNQYKKEIEDLLIKKNIDQIIIYLSKI